MGSEITPELSADATPTEGCKTIHHAILAVRKQVAYIQKKKPSGLSYTIAAIDDIIKEARPLMNHYGVMIYPQSQAVANETTFTTSRGSEMREVVVACTWKLVHADSGTEISMQTIGQAADTQDKSVPKATTAAFKECLRRIFVIESGEMDPDTYASQQRRVSESGAVRSARYLSAETALRGVVDRQRLSGVWGRIEKSSFNPDEIKDLWQVRNEVVARMGDGEPSGPQPAQAARGIAPANPGSMNPASTNPAPTNGRRPIVARG